MEYMSPAYKDIAPADGLILQAPVADRGALTIELGPEGLDRSVRAAKALIDSGKGHERIPIDQIPEGFPPISAQRWYALAAEE